MEFQRCSINLKNPNEFFSTTNTRVSHTRYPDVDHNMQLSHSSIHIREIYFTIYLSSDVDINILHSNTYYNDLNNYNLYKLTYNNKYTKNMVFDFSHFVKICK